MSRGIEKSCKKTESEEVEELLRAAEDDVFLKLSLNSHVVRGSCTQFMDSDLDQRFLALRSKKTPAKDPLSQKRLDNQPPSASLTTDESDDLFTRFAALKSSLTAYSSASSSAKQQAAVENEEDDDEVEKVIKWAIDAARLDHSSASETDDDDDNNTDEDDAKTSEDDFKCWDTKAKRK